MAINKKQASPAVKIGIIIVAVMLVLAFALPLMSPNLFSSGTTSDATTDAGQLDAIATQFAGTVAAYQQQLASDPTSVTVLVGIGNTYSDWANAIMQYQGGPGGADLPVWVATTSFYERALLIEPNNPNVSTDLAIAYYYSGDVGSAIGAVEGVMIVNPDFAPAFFNAAIFYKSVGMPQEAVAAAARFLELDPSGQFGDPATAQGIIDELGSVEATTAP